MSFGNPSSSTRTHFQAVHDEHTSRMADGGLTIMFEHCNDHSYRAAHSGSYSGRSSPDSCGSPVTPIFPHPLDVAASPEESWNLIPYDVPWGQDYYAYRTGTLPGPDGACIFLRSPTPLKNRRTQKACNRCRQRKAKCSGSRPACTRCLARGYICEYVEEERRGSTGGRREREGSTYSSPHSDGSYEPDFDMCTSRSSISTAPSDDTGAATPELVFGDGESCSAYDSPAVAYSPHCWDDMSFALAAAAPYGYEGAADVYEERDAFGAFGDEGHAFAAAAAQQMMYHHDVPPHLAGPAVHAPRPVRCGGSPAFLGPEQAHPYAMMQQQRVVQQEDMLISLPTASEPLSHIAIPQLPLMQPAEQEPQSAMLDFVQSQPLYYFTPDQPQYPTLQYDYSMPAYTPSASESIAPEMLYSMVQAEMAA